VIRGFVRALPVIFFLFACKKQDGNIIIDGQGNAGQMQLFVTDTLSINAVTVREDSIPGNNLRYVLLGSMNDPMLGTISSGAYAQCGLLEPNSDFPNTEEPDSAVLFIPFINGLNFYGDKQTPQGFTINPLKTGITSNNTYYQGDVLETDPTLESRYFGPVYNFKSDSIRYKKGKSSITPGIRVRLSYAMARKLMQMPKEAYTSQEKLIENFPGIAIMPEKRDLGEGKGGLGVYDFNNIISFAYRAKILLYYRDTATQVFTFTGSKSTINKGMPGVYKSVVIQQLNNPTQSFAVTYAQAPNGLKTHLRIPHLLNLLGLGNIAINKAELQLFVAPGTTTTLHPAPGRLNLFQPSGKTSDINTFLEDGISTNFGGTYDEASGSYRFVLTKHIQNLLNAKKFYNEDYNFGLYLAVPSDQPVSGARVAIDHSKTKLIITYTKLN
jgi:hypothetical protein